MASKILIPIELQEFIRKKFLYEKSRIYGRSNHLNHLKVTFSGNGYFELDLSISRTMNAFFSYYIIRKLKALSMFPHYSKTMNAFFPI